MFPLFFFSCTYIFVLGVFFFLFFFSLAVIVYKNVRVHDFSCVTLVHIYEGTCDIFVS